MSDTTVQLNPEGTGPKIRSEKVRQFSEDGLATQTDVHQQVVTLATRFGAFVESDTAWREEMLTETRQTRELLELILEALT